MSPNKGSSFFYFAKNTNSIVGKTEKYFCKGAIKMNKIVEIIKAKKELRRQKKARKNIYKQLAAIASMMAIFVESDTVQESFNV